MTALYYPPKFDSGLPGAKLWFYQTNTTTPQNTYTDEALAVASSNPVVADADGVFEPIYLDPTLPNYRVKYTTSADVLLYQVDDVPSNQGVQQSVRLQSTNPFLFLYDTDGTTNKRKYAVRANGASFEVALVDDAEAVYTTILQFYDGILYSNQTEVAVTSSGQFTGTVTGLTATVTGTFYYRKVNNVVHMWVATNVTGTSNATTMTLTGLPSAIQPSAQKLIICSDLVDSNAPFAGLAAVDGASITFARLTVSGSYVRSDGTFTNSGVKGIGTGWSITYSVD